MFFVTAGDTDQTIDIFLQDSSSSTGGGLTGLTYSSSGLTCYFRKGATGTVTQLTLASQTVGGSHTDGGFVELDSTNAPGTYRLDLSDAMVSAEGALTIYLHGATNLLQTPIRVHVASATRGYTGTAVPAAAADAAGGLVISDAGGLDVDTYLGRITGNVALASSLPSNFSLLGINGSGHVSQVTLVDTTTVNSDMVDVSALATASSIASLNNFDPLSQTVTTDSASRIASQADVSALATAANLAIVDTVVDDIKVTADKLDDTFELDGSEYRFTANALEEAPSGGGGGGGSAPTEAEIYTYFTASSREDVFKADVSALATAASISALNDFDPAAETVTTDSASRTASQADVSALATAASISALNDFDPAAETVTTDSASRTASQADVSALATAVNLATVDNVVDAIKAVTDNLPNSGALSDLATAASITALNDISVADILASALTESYSTDGAAPTLTQAVMLILQHLSESSITGTTKTVKQLDGSTTAATFTLDDASSPSSITRAT